MEDNNTKRLSRLTSILTQLQSKRIVTAPALAKKYNVSVRTIYRDMRALEESGIPVLTEEGKGYTIMEGFHLQPIMLTEREAFAMITAEQLILKHKDSSLIKEFSEAVLKIKAVLRHYNKDKVALLEERTFVGKNYLKEITSKCLIDIQLAITDYRLIKISYLNADGKSSDRLVEPFLVFHSKDENWTVVAYCRMRKDFRTFRLDRMRQIQFLNEHFPPHKLTIKQFAERFKEEK